ncbi:uncharacterized protein BYT42DRAFT_537559 [Radiomyces spectabilis]|uniref:uncharacterized protein n=1 Tax=Radiomyces spectabilis TaxID=64574 RepID=UPI00221E7EF1|nr:uncharacterized protein BYT42DRAFT_537559 [Radiomyces spectabilis]KAI8371700.1 hypothetical protein BYT42DRAFT_537559 [Radiomyces spectabilis]
MLHVQESIPHSGSFMLSPLLAPSPVVHPQPSLSTSSRSTRVIEQLQATLDSIQKEVMATKSQLETIRQTKRQYELEAQSYIECNAEYRKSIQELMHILETKQHRLNDTKRSSTDLESKVKKFKDEALASRKQLEDLRRKEQVLERDRNVAVAERDLVVRQQHVLKQSVDMLKSRFDREVVSLKQDLSLVHMQIQTMTEKSQTMVKLMETKVSQRALTRQQLMTQLTLVRRQMENNTQTFLDRIRAELQALLDDVDQSTRQTDNFQFAVTRCRGEVNGLIARIKAYTAETSATD